MRFKSKAALFVGCAIAALSSAVVRAETPHDGNDTPPDARYRVETNKFGTFRFDLVTGKLEKVTFTQDGVVISEVPVQRSNQPAGGATASAQRKPAIEVDEPREKTNTGSAATLSGPRRPVAPLIEGGEDITDEDRKAAIPDIARYEKDLSIMQLIRSGGDRITGAITVANNGGKNIQKLEITLYVPVAEKQPQEYHFLYVDNGEANAPLQPIGGKALSWLQPVDVASPPGSTKGNLDVKVTYIKFYDKK